jgi:hypothetical protein
MKGVTARAVIASLVLVLSVSPSWAGGRPATNDDSDGSFNTGGGTGALGANTFGFNNTAYGYSALASNTQGFHNTACGSKALFANTTGRFKQEEADRCDD